MTCHVEDCEGCRISQGEDKEVKKRGGIIALKGNWTLNHYGGKEGFLGWMIIQPRCHRGELTDLTRDEAEALGENIQSVDRALRQYWHEKFPDDDIERVYVVYFHESVFGSRKKRRQSRRYWHMHVHLIPRTKKLGRLLRRYDSDGSIRAWSMPEIVRLNKGEFPPAYKRNLRKYSALVRDLRRSLQVRSTAKEKPTTMSRLKGRGQGAVQAVRSGYASRPGRKQ